MGNVATPRRQRLHCAAHDESITSKINNEEAFMELARPALIVALVLALLTLWYTGQWAANSPRPDSAKVELAASSDNG